MRNIFINTKFDDGGKIKKTFSLRHMEQSLIKCQGLEGDNELQSGHHFTIFVRYP